MNVPVFVRKIDAEVAVAPKTVSFIGTPSLSLAWKNMIHDRARLAVSLVGVAFAVLLMLVQSGMYLGFMGSASAVIDHSKADLWVVAADTVNFDAAFTFSDDQVAAVRGVPGVAQASAVLHTMGHVRLPSGRGTFASIVGFDLGTGLGGPWDMVRGSAADLRRTRSYIADLSSLPQMSDTGVGDLLEVNDRQLRIVGLCRGARTQTTYPILFTSLDTAQALPSLENRSNFVLARLDPGADVDVVKERLRRLARFETLTREEFSRRTRRYWATRTGIGIAIGLMIALGFVVGLVVVGQTLYSSTMERLREYATLKSLGATNGEIASIILAQAMILGLAGYAVGAAASLLAATAYTEQVVSVQLPPGLFLAIFTAAMAMCGAASLLSIVRVLRVSPAEVFRS